jgi:metal-responsive CopG/Arc/MetJ family transcriptional regulator
MQVSIYLGEELVKRVDRLAKTERRSRSKIIETLLESSLKKNEGNRLERLVGTWKDNRSAKEIIKDIYKDRARNRRSEHIGL